MSQENVIKVKVALTPFHVPTGIAFECLLSRVGSGIKLKSSLCNISEAFFSTLREKKERLGNKVPLVNVTTQS